MVVLESVTKTEDFLPAFERARSSGKPAIIELKTDPLALSPQTPANTFHKIILLHRV